MPDESTYEELVEIIKELEQKATEYKRLEAQALMANERLQYLLSSTKAVIYTSKKSGDYGATFISENVTQMTGYEAQEFIEKSSFWFDHVHPEDQPRISSEVTKLYETDLHAYEYRFQCKDRSYIWMWDEMKLVRNKDGNPLEIIGYWVDITARKRVEKELREAHNDLEYRVKERTRELEVQSNRLQEANMALKVLLEQSEVHKKELEDKVLSNVKELVNPYVEKLRMSRLHPTQKELVSLIESNLDNIVSPFIRKLSMRQYNLTPKEIRVANLVKAGKKNKEIAEILSVSHNTIIFHRFNIRTKLGLRNKNINLKSHLASFDI